MSYGWKTRTKGATTGIDTAKKSPRRANALDPEPSPSPTPESEYLEKKKPEYATNRGQNQALTDLEAQEKRDRGE